MNKEVLQEAIPEQLFEDIKQKLIANELVRYKLPEGGRLHIDRQLPFLIVHRRIENESDKGTRQLLLGEASYIQTSASASLQGAITALVQMIANNQAQQYGAFLIIELWSREVQVADEEELPEPGFHIIAPEHPVPYQTLETLEHALEDITLRGKPARVKISYHDQPAPPGLPFLLDSHQKDSSPIIFFGLEVDAVYRNPATKTLLSFAFKKIHHGLATALKKTFYAFSHNHTTCKPEHFHVLGRRSMTDDVWEVDRQLAEVSDSFDLLLHVTPTNSHREWLKFQESHYQKIPEFHYRPRTADPSLLKRKLFQAPIEKIEDPALSDFFSSKRDELDKQISLLAARGLPDFLYGSIQLYGTVEEPLMDLAEAVLAHTADGTKQNDSTINASQLAEYATAEVGYYQQQAPNFDCKVEVRDDISGILVSHGNFLISSDAVLRKNRLNATLNHEIGTHAVTHYNGRQQPFQQLYAGMAGYEELQEGLAVLSEYLVGELDLSRMRLLAGRVIAAQGVINGADFIETFQKLTQAYEFTPHQAYLITLRVHRGGGYTKDMVYLRGFSRLLDYLKKNGGDSHEKFNILYTGKVSMEFLPLIEELSWREVIRPVALMPRYLQQEESVKNLEQLIQEPTIERILRDL